MTHTSHAHYLGAALFSLLGSQLLACSHTKASKTASSCDDLEVASNQKDELRVQTFAPEEVATAEELHEEALSSLLEPSAELVTHGTPGWGYETSATADLDGDGDEETLWLMANVPISQDGEPEWGDVQEWQIYVEEADGPATHLLARIVQLGDLEVSITAREQPTILMHTSSHASEQVHELVYNGPHEVTLRTLMDRGVLLRPQRVNSDPQSSGPAMLSQNRTAR